MSTTDTTCTCPKPAGVTRAQASAAYWWSGCPASASLPGYVLAHTTEWGKS